MRCLSPWPVSVLAGIFLFGAAATAQDHDPRERILTQILANIECCSTSQRFLKPAAAGNIPSNLGIAIAGDPTGKGMIQFGTVIRGADGKPAFDTVYALDARCRVGKVASALVPTATFYTVGEIAARKPKEAAEHLWPVVNATFQSALLSMLKLPSPVERHRCLRQHLERVIHGEERQP